MIRPGRAILGAALAVAGLSAAPAHAQLPSPPELRQQFQEADRDGNAKLDREEFHRRSVEVFYFLDKDRKGYLVLADLKGLTPEEFKAADRNGEGRLSLDEFINARFRQFELADTNGDGVLTIVEVEAYVQRVR